jgi:hypothetical protein
MQMPPSNPDPSSAQDHRVIELCASILDVEAESERLASPYWSATTALPAEVAGQLEVLAQESKELREMLANCPAATLAGWRAKAEVIRVQWGQDAIPDGEIAWSLVNDILAGPRSV